MTIEMINWPFAITEFYAAEMEACSQVDNLAINTNLLDSASLREQVASALSGGDLVGRVSTESVLAGPRGWQPRRARQV